MELDERIKTTDRAQKHPNLANSEVNRVVDELTQSVHHPEIDSLLPQTNTNLSEFLDARISEMYRELIGTQVVNNFSISELIAGSTYYVCRNKDIPRTLNEVSAACLSNYFPVESTSISRPRPTWTPYMKRTVRAHRRVCSVLDINSTPVEPVEFIKRYIAELRLSEEVREVFLVILQTLDQEVQSGVPSHAFAAGIIKVACDRTNTEIIIKSGIAHPLNISPDSVYQQYQNVDQALG